MTVGTKVRHFRLSLIISVAGATLFTALLALVTPYNKALVIAFTFISQTFCGWGFYLSITFVQQGVGQIELGIAGGLGSVTCAAGGSSLKQFTHQSW